jgi:hypothetical protein
MSLILSSSDKTFDAMLRHIDSDGAVSAVEFQAVRDGADKHVLDATGFETASPQMAFAKSVVQLLYQADGLVETMQRVALEARKKKLPADKRQALKAAAEHQIAYIVAGYKSSIERL